MSDREYRAELLDVVVRGIENHPRSQQKRIGPSEVGTPCTRKLGYKLAGTPEANHGAPAWRATVGTATHTWLTGTFMADNTLSYPESNPRWMTDVLVTVGEIDGVLITGHLDLFDLYTDTVIDWKIPGPTTMKARKRSLDPGMTYRAQTQLYGRGVRNLGLACSRVGILFMPSAGQLTDSLLHTEAYDEQVAIDALTRADGVAAAIRLLGADAVLPQLITSEDYCSRCEWFVPGSTDGATSCAGSERITQLKGDPKLAALMGA